MNLNLRFWQVVALTLAFLAAEREWLAQLSLIGALSWIAGAAYTWFL